MKNINKILFVGGDRRTAAIAENIMTQYPEAEIVFWHTGCALPAGCRTGEDLQTEAGNADVIILPLPLTADGENTKVTGTAGEEEKLPLRPFLEKLPVGKLILGGQIPVFYKRFTEECGSVCRDYFDSETVQLRNAIPTAEGAIGIAVAELPVTVADCPVVVMGYGRCGYALASRLHLLGAEVTVAVRRREAQVMAEGDGCRAMSIREFQKNPPPCRILFNTIPAPILPAETLRKLPENTLLVELASGKGGILPEDAEKTGMRLIRAPGLPGKTAPETAGKILAETILEWIDDYRGKEVCVKD